MKVHRHKINIIKLQSITYNHLYNHVCKQVILVIIFFPQFDWLNLSSLAGPASKSSKAWLPINVAALGQRLEAPKMEAISPQTSGRTLTSTTTTTPDTLEFGPYEPWNLLPPCQVPRIDIHRHREDLMRFWWFPLHFLRPGSQKKACKEPFLWGCDVAWNTSGTTFETHEIAVMHFWCNMFIHTKAVKIERHSFSG